MVSSFNVKPKATVLTTDRKLDLTTIEVLIPPRERQINGKAANL